MQHYKALQLTIKSGALLAFSVTELNRYKQSGVSVERK